MSVLNLDLVKILKDSPALVLIKGIPHTLCDMQGQVISSSGEIGSFESKVFFRAIKYAGTPVLTFKSVELDRLSSEIYPILENMVLQDIKLVEKMNFFLAQGEMEKTSRECLSALLAAFHGEGIELKRILEMALINLRSHIPVETCSIFLLSDGEEGECLKGEVGLMKGAKVDFGKSKPWKVDETSIMGITAITQQYYIAGTVYQDPNYKVVPEYDAPINLACFPIAYKGALLGVLNLKNNINSLYGASSIKFILKNLIILEHIIHSQRQKDLLEKSKITKAELGIYVSSNVMENIEAAAEGKKLKAGSVKKKAVCLFCDIRSFTSISEKVGPALLVQLLNIYFSELIPIIERYEGTVDKLVGDMIAAFWNLPQDVLDPELKAIKAAVEMQKTMVRKVAPAWGRAGISRVGIGIGIHSGQVIAGNLGASRLMNYTVMGDTVYNAEKLESLARPGEVWVSEEVNRLTEGKVWRTDRIVKGIEFKGAKALGNAYVLRPVDYPDY